MTKDKIKALSDVTFNELQEYFKEKNLNPLEEIALSLIFMELLKLIVALPVKMYQHVPIMLRLIANGFEVIVKENEKK